MSESTSRLLGVLLYGTMCAIVGCSYGRMAKASEIRMDQKRQLDLQNWIDDLHARCAKKDCKSN